MSDQIEKPMPQAVVLCGGQGTRLRAVYDAGPKALVPIAGRPLLGYVLDRLRGQGVREVVLSVGYLHEQIEALFPEGAGDPLVRYSVEQEPLGTAGALKLAEPLLDPEAGCFFALNGDCISDVPLEAMLAFHRARNAAATLAAIEVPDAARYGTVELDAEGRLTSFREKDPAAGAATINGGVYVLSRDVLAQISARRKVSIEREVFPALVGRGLYGFRTGGYFIDVGVPEDLARAQNEVPEQAG